MRSMRNNPQTKRRFRPKRLLLLLPIVAIVGLVWWGISQAGQAGRKWLAGTSWSTLEKVEVRGLIRLPEQDIIRAAKVKPNVNLLEIEIDSVAARVAALPPVLKARVFRRFPGRLMIRVVEREPIVGIGSGSLQLVDEQGIAFPPVCGGEVLDLPIITGDFKQMTDSDGFRKAFNLLLKMREKHPVIFDQLGEINSSRGKLSIRLKQGGALVIAKDPGSDETLMALEAFLVQKENELPPSMDYVNMRYPAMIITGKRGSN